MDNKNAITEQQIREVFSDFSQEGLYSNFFEKVLSQLQLVRENRTLNEAESMLAALGYDLKELNSLEILYIYSNLP